MLAPSKDWTPLLGRSAEIEVLTELLDDVERTGAALVLRGDPGIGKSRLLAEAIGLAEARGMNVLASRGIQSEARLAFGGLQQLLRPVRSQAAGLTAAHQPVLEAALASATMSGRSTFVSRWPCSTFCPMRRPTAPCCWSRRTPIGWTSLP